MQMEEIFRKILEIIVEYGPRLIGAIAVWIIGSWIIKALTKGIARMMEKRKTDKTLRPFLKGLFGTLLKVLLIISVLGTLGIQMLSFVAILGAAGLAIGMALSGTLKNFAGGVMLLVLKPFQAGDLIEAQGYLGKVSKIQISNTILKTLDNKTIIIPNGGLSTSSMVNYSTEDKRRVDWTFGIGYGDSIDQAKKVMQKLCDEDQRILEEPEVFIAVSELADSSVNFTVRAWVKAEDYWNVKFDMNEKIYKTFNQEGLNIPFPQMDVHVHEQ
jgi:small conductance mechanosensitive channel